MKIGKFYEQPKIYLLLLLFSVFIFLTFDRTAGTVLALLSLGAWSLYHTTRPRLRINGIKGNTLNSIVIGGIGVGLTIGLSMIVGSVFFGWTPASIVEFLTANKGAVIGAGTLPFQGNLILTWITFVLAFPITETAITIQIFDLLLRQFNIPLNLKDFRVYAVAMVMAVGAIFYHIYAKSTISGAPNPNILLVIGAIFFVECLISVYSKEAEPAIWHHIINNAIALL